MTRTDDDIAALFDGPRRPPIPAPAANQPPPHLPPDVRETLRDVFAEATRVMAETGMLPTCAQRLRRAIGGWRDECRFALAALLRPLRPADLITIRRALMDGAKLLGDLTTTPKLLPTQRARLIAARQRLYAATDLLSGASVLPEAGETASLQPPREAQPAP